MKEIRFSEHSRLKTDILASRGVGIDLDFVIETVRSPDKLEIGEEDKYFNHYPLFWEEI